MWNHHVPGNDHKSCRGLTSGGAEIWREEGRLNQMPIEWARVRSKLEIPLLGQRCGMAACADTACTATGGLEPPSFCGDAPFVAVLLRCLTVHSLPGVLAPFELPIQWHSACSIIWLGNACPAFCPLVVSTEVHRMQTLV